MWPRPAEDPDAADNSRAQWGPRMPEDPDGSTAAPQMPDVYRGAAPGSTASSHAPGPGQSFTQGGAGVGTQDRPLPQWPQQRSPEETAAAASGPPSRAENRVSSAEQTPPRPDQPARMLGKEEVGAAQRELENAGGRVVDTSSGRTDGLNKCPRCGSSETRYEISMRALVCMFCRHQWNEANAEEAFGLNTSIAGLQGHTLASGTRNIDEAAASIITLKCQGCGAEVVIPVDETLQARCHWCRQTLSINTQIPNGAVPDAVLPFLLTREQGAAQIQEFVKSRWTFADEQFKSQFRAENVIGVYIPYMVVDGNLHTELHGVGEVTTREYQVRRKVGEDSYRYDTYYDADVYQVRRAFDLLVDDLTIEAASRYDAREARSATNNILNAVQPYDTDAAVAFNPNYLKGFNAEKRDLNVRDLDDRVEEKFLSIAREKVRPTISEYDRGVRWTAEGVAVRGSRWFVVAVPVWLYSYAQEAAGGQGLTHYVAVNGRTGKTMGSVPVLHGKIFAASCALGGVVGAIAMIVAIIALISSMSS